MSTVATLATFLVLLAVALAQKQEAILYSEYNGEGNMTKLPWRYSSDLSLEDFANKTSSVCLTGVWLFYQDTHFNPNGNRRVESIFGKNDYCTNIRTIAGAISSVRYAGAPNDYKTESLTIYQHDYFQGREEFISKDTENLIQFYGANQSVIVTGKSDWTVYSQPNFQGYRVCLLLPDPYSFTLVPSFVENLRNQTTSDGLKLFPYGSIRSVRKGCNATFKLNMSSF